MFTKNRVPHSRRYCVALPGFPPTVASKTGRGFCIDRLEDIYMSGSLKILKLNTLKTWFIALLVCTTIAGSAVSASCTSVSNSRIDLLLNMGWKFIRTDVSQAVKQGFDDSAWDTVNLPHTWNAIDGEQPNYYRGRCWYRTHMPLSAAKYGGKKLYLQFDGANLKTEVFVNGVKLGTHHGGYAGFRFDATATLHLDADNVIAVAVDNSYQVDTPPLSADYTFFGGLYRSVHLIATQPLHISTMNYGSSGVYLKQSNVSVDSADLQVTAKVSNDSSMALSADVKAEVVDANNRVVTTLISTVSVGSASTHDVILTGQILNPRLWEGRAEPYLYTVRVAVGSTGEPADIVTQPLGFRTIEVDPARGFFLNGSYLDLHGVNRHQDYDGLGWAIGPTEIDQDFALIDEIGANTIRLCHYQHDQYVYDRCDKTGIICWAEVPLINRITDSSAFTANSKLQLTELICQNYNHPSIAFWSLANEISNRPGPITKPLLEEMNTLAHSLDPDRLTTVAALSQGGAVTDSVGVNRYMGWYYGSTSDFAPWADKAHESHPTLPIGVSEFGAGASIKHHSDTPRATDHTEEYQCLFHEVYWKAMAVRPFLWGKFVWNMFDFASSTRREGDEAGMNDKGLVTYDRLTPKDSFYWYKANWSAKPFAYITSRRYVVRLSSEVPVKVYSNCDAVELFVNGVSWGKRTSADHIFKWANIPLELGTNRISIVGTHSGRDYTDACIWTRQ